MALCRKLDKATGAVTREYDPLFLPAMHLCLAYKRVSISSRSPGYCHATQLLGARLVAQALDWDTAKIYHFLSRMGKGEEPLLPTKHYSPQEMVQKILEIHPVTELDHLAMGSATGFSDVEGSERHRSKFDAHYQGICEPSTLARVFGAPLLPVFEPTRASRGYAAYSVQSRQVFELVLRALLEGEPTALMRAAVMEELFIF